MDASLISGYPRFHNYVYPNKYALYRKTLSEIYEIEIKGDNKWLTLIQNIVKEIKNNDV